VVISSASGLLVVSTGELIGPTDPSHTAIWGPHEYLCSAHAGSPRLRRNNVLSLSLVRSLTEEIGNPRIWRAES
jgi:hypothetical protein